MFDADARCVILPAPSLFFILKTLVLIERCIGEWIQIQNPKASGGKGGAVARPRDVLPRAPALVTPWRQTHHDLEHEEGGRPRRQPHPHPHSPLASHASPLMSP